MKLFHRDPKQLKSQAEKLDSWIIAGCLVVAFLLVITSTEFSTWIKGVLS
jgi:hypothetical protein